KKDYQQRARVTKSNVEEFIPDIVIEMHAEFDPDCTKDEKPQDDRERQIEAAEAGCVEHGEGKKQRSARSEQPDFIPVPHWSDRAQQLSSLLLVAGSDQMQCACTEVKAIEDDVGRQHQ